MGGRREKVGLKSVWRLDQRWREEIRRQKVSFWMGGGREKLTFKAKMKRSKNDRTKIVSNDTRRRAL